MRVCLVYPNVYSLAMANLGFQMVYHLFNSIDECVCERAFLPSIEDREEHGRTGTPLLSYESQTPLGEFDILAFSIPFEEDYVHIPAIMDLSRVPVISSERTEAHPLVIAGGVGVSLNPEPVADFFDLFIIGEGEETTGKILKAYMDSRESGKKDTIERLSKLDAVYVPSFFEFAYDGIRVVSIKTIEGAREKIKAAKTFNLDRFPLPENFIQTPFSEFRDTRLVEIERGCGRGCRFCAAGFLYLPPRWRDIESVKRSVERGIRETGKVGLIGTAVSEYPHIKDTINAGIELEGTVTLSSLRLDRLDREFLDLLHKSGYRTITLAPEAGTERMRRAVNKGMTDEEILDSIRLITEAGFSRIKLYFLVGLPGETDGDAEGIVELAKTIKGIMKKGELILSVNPFIPKPFTPFQWHPFEDVEVIERRLDIIKKGLMREGGIKVDAMTARDAHVQAYLSRADRRAGKIIIEAAGNGWKKTVKAHREFINRSVHTAREREETLPWDLIDHGVGKKYFWREYQKALEGTLTPPCNVGMCYRCGVCSEEFLKG